MPYEQAPYNGYDGYSDTEYRGGWAGQGYCPPGGYPQQQSYGYPQQGQDAWPQAAYPQQNLQNPWWPAQQGYPYQFERPASSPEFAAAQFYMLDDGNDELPPLMMPETATYGFEAARPLPPEIAAPVFEEAVYEEEKPAAPAVAAPSMFVRIFRIVSTVLIYAFCAAIVAGALAFAFSKDTGKNYFGYRGYAVVSPSMTPRADGSTPKGLGPAGGFGKGAMLFVRMLPASAIKVGDVITFNPNSRDDAPEAYLTHRVVEVLHELHGEEGLWFVTQGDANNSPDPPIMSEMVIGRKAFHVPAMGVVTQLIRGHMALSLTAFLCFFACIFMLRWFFSKPAPEPDPRKKAVPAARKRQYA